MEALEGRGAGEEGGASSWLILLVGRPFCRDLGGRGAPLGSAAWRERWAHLVVGARRCSSARWRGGAQPVNQHCYDLCDLM